jgi:uncharacterized membrane protein YdjX (TVP38/TMEM64 family)
MKKKAEEILMFLFIAILFVLSSYFAHTYSDELKNLQLFHGAAGQFVYVLIMAGAVIIAPAETLPLLPIAVSVWGANWAASLTIIGWVIGSMIAFFIAKKFGRKIVNHFVEKYDIDELREALPKKNLFWAVAFARIFLPVDIVSYAVALFTRMHWFTYLSATVLGTAVFAFLFAYGAEMPPYLQIIAGIIIFIFIIFEYRNIKKRLKELF